MRILLVEDDSSTAKSIELMLKSDLNRGFVWRLAEKGGIIPPFTLEIVLVDGMYYYVHSVADRDEKTGSMKVRIWDTGRMSDTDIERCRTAVDALEDLSALADPAGIHSRLQTGVLRIDMDQVAYCVEWHHPLWSSEESRRPGYKLH